MQLLFVIISQVEQLRLSTSHGETLKGTLTLKNIPFKMNIYVK